MEQAYSYFIFWDPYTDAEQSYCVVHNNVYASILYSGTPQETNWHPTLSNALNNFKSSLVHTNTWVTNKPIGPLTLKEVTEDLINCEVSHWQIIYYGNELPTIEKYPELFL